MAKDLVNESGYFSAVTEHDFGYSASRSSLFHETACQRKYRGHPYNLRREQSVPHSDGDSSTLSNDRMILRSKYTRILCEKEKSEMPRKVKKNESQPMQQEARHNSPGLEVQPWDNRATSLGLPANGSPRSHFGSLQSRSITPHRRSKTEESSNIRLTRSSSLGLPANGATQRHTGSRQRRSRSPLFSSRSEDGSDIRAAATSNGLSGSSSTRSPHLGSREQCRRSYRHVRSSSYEPNRRDILDVEIGDSIPSHQQIRRGHARRRYINVSTLPRLFQMVTGMIDSFYELEEDERV